VCVCVCVCVCVLISRSRALFVMRYRKLLKLRENGSILHTYRAAYVNSYEVAWHVR
jgi:hypothetical protein